MEWGSSRELTARKRHRLLSSGSSSSSELDMGEVEEERSVNEMPLCGSSPRTVEDGAPPGSPGIMDLGGCDSDGGIDYHGGWQPGLNTGSFLDARAAPPRSQARVLIANCYLNLKRCVSCCVQNSLVLLESWRACRRQKLC